VAGRTAAREGIGAAKAPSVEGVEGVRGGGALHMAVGAESSGVEEAGVGTVAAWYRCLWSSKACKEIDLALRAC
jgi:hypothetical protein